MALSAAEGAGTNQSGFNTPGQGRGLLEVFRWRYLLRLLVRKETSTRYRNSVLGWVWSYVRPAAQFIIFYLVMGVFLQMARGIENFAMYLFSGIIVINFFSEGFSNATRSLVDNAHLVRKIYMPRELFPVAAVIVSFVHFLPQAAVLLVVALIFGWLPLPMYLGAAILGILIVGLAATGLGLFFGSLNVAFRDAQNFVELILMVAVWASPVLYSWQMVASQVPEWLMLIYQINPLTAGVELFHLAFWDPVTAGAHSLPDNFWTTVWIATAITVAGVLIGQWVFRKIEPRFAQDL
ncbi:ABC transporter permease [Leucobacter muris]|uniref:Transport permease protein n=1 Tax=Leucobacter muris TaxID=1935379 RepID=A0ABX5QCP5_9MICO|nr:ABC transporter permease [Leucobacter muris]QAB16811.1 ABC transporter permease [Leucobacter muris]